MKQLIFRGLGIAVIALAGLVAVVVWPIGWAIAPIAEVGDVARGAYLARGAGCIACHTDVAGGGAALAGGVKIATPFGVLLTPNLTTDSQRGIGGWTQEDFAVAVRQGVSPDGQAYYPAFPYPFYANFTDQEIADLWAAFQTVPPIGEDLPTATLRFPFDQKWGLKLWRLAYLEPPATAAVAGKGERWNRGRLLVEGAGHCAACHTARNFLGARKTAVGHLKGNAALPDGSKAPAIDAKSLRAAGWTVDDLAYALETGFTPTGDSFGAGMGEVVAQGTSFLSGEDRDAIARYLLDEPQQEQGE